MSSASQLIFIQRNLTRYGMTLYITLGSIGLIFNIIIFSQTARRKHSCSLYICAVSFCSLIGMNMSLIPGIYALDHPNPLTSSLIFCQLQFYILHVFNQSMRTFIVIACADRSATCNHRAKIRLFSQYKIAIRIIPSILIFWILIAIFPTMMRSLVDDVCDALPGIYNIIYSIYILIVLGIFPLISMFTFGILMIRSLKQMRTRVQPGNDINTLSTAHHHHHHVFRKRDRDMMRMLLIELSLYIITTIPMTISLIYKSVTQSVVKSIERQQIESFIFYFTRLFLLYFNNSLSFWIYITTSQSFREEFKKLIIKWFQFFHQKFQK